jgi:hypothetical protein
LSPTTELLSILICKTPRLLSESLLRKQLRYVIFPTSWEVQCPLNAASWFGLPEVHVITEWQEEAVLQNIRLDTLLLLYSIDRDAQCL